MRKITILLISLAFLISSPNLVKADNSKNCLPHQNLAEGPYYLPSPERSTLNIKELGHNIELNLTLLDKNCRPIKALKVSLWQTNALGEYSKVEGKGILELRGYQVTDKKGNVKFKTIIPGWYPGRTSHLHIKVTDKNKVLLTSQLFFPPKSNIETIYKMYPYSIRGQADTSLSKDTIYNSIKNKSEYLLKYKSKNSYSKQLHIAI